MANDVVDVVCPCCHAALRVDRESGTVLSQKIPEKPPSIDDLGVAARALKGEAAKREEIFQKSFAEHKTRQTTLDKKFDELLKQAKESPDTGPQKRDIDL
jgi:hypothetical protein